MSRRVGRSSRGGSQQVSVKKVPASVQLLETRLQSYDPEIREQAYKGLEKLGAPEEPLVDKIMEQFDHQNWYVREAGLNAIGYCVDAGCADLAGRSVEPHLEHEDPHIRFCAGRALLKIEERVQPLLESLKVQRADATLIAQAAIPAENSADMLCQRLQHEDPKIRQNALDALSRMHKYCLPHATTMCALVLDPNLSVRNELVRVIDRLGSILVDGVNVLAAALGQEEEKMRRSGVRCLTMLSHSNGAEVAQAVAELLNSEDKVTRIAALDCLGSFGALAGPHGAEMANHLEELDADVRLSTVRAIIAGGKPMGAHMSVLKKRTQHEHPDISRAAVQTLRGLASLCPKIAKSAFKDLEEEPENRTRMIAIEVLAGAGHNVKPYLEEIAKALEDKDWGLRRVAIEALCDLGEHGDAAASEVARRLLHHDPDVRRAAAEALGRMGLHAGEYGHRVEGLLDTEEDEDVKRTCAAACQMLYTAGMEHG